METNHTKAPWVIEKIESKSHPEPYYEIQYGEDGECVAEYVHKEEDAKLIVAAPKMLDALIEAKAHLVRAGYRTGGRIGKIIDEAIKQATE